MLYVVCFVGVPRWEEKRSIGPHFWYSLSRGGWGGGGVKVSVLYCCVAAFVIGAHCDHLIVMTFEGRNAWGELTGSGASHNSAGAMSVLLECCAFVRSFVPVERTELIEHVSGIDRSGEDDSEWTWILELNESRNWVGYFLITERISHQIERKFRAFVRRMLRLNWTRFTCSFVRLWTSITRG